jgi:sugar phosphate isomerase/epimerase
MAKEACRSERFPAQECSHGATHFRLPAGRALLNPLPSMSTNTSPKLHNAMWPGLVGKTPGTDESPLSLDRMLELTANAEVDGQKFDGVDIFLFDPHIPIDIDEDALKVIADKIAAKGLNIGSVVAPVWPGTVGASAMGDAEDRAKFVLAVKKACRITTILNNHGVRKYGVIRIDSAVGPDQWYADPAAGTQKIAETFREAAIVAEDNGERLAAEGEICWGGMHSWRNMVDLLEEVGQPKLVGFQADMAHTLLYTLGYNEPKHRLVPENFKWEPEAFHVAMTKLTKALRPWTLDFHVAQNDATVKGSGTHDKTGRHCVVTDPRGKLNIPRDAGYWMRDEKGKVTKKFKHICWDGCMFSNDIMTGQQIWNDILASMLQVRENHGWRA